MSQLTPFFPGVTIARFEDTLAINEVEPIINYYKSFNGMHEGLVVLSEEDIDEFRPFLQNIMDLEKR